MANTEHWHYASDIHGGAEKHHRHYDLERQVAELERQVAAFDTALADAEGRADNLAARVAELESAHRADVKRLWDHISNMPGGI